MQSKTKIFIPFLEGTLNYNCKECGYQCCKGGAIKLNAKQKAMILHDYPFLKYFFLEETKETYRLRIHPKCWFLNNNGACDIEQKHGYHSKPFVCRLFPFYVHRCKNEHIVIPSGCEFLSLNKEKTNILHEQILENAQKSIDLDDIETEIDWSKKRLELEKKILQESKRFFDSPSYLDFSAHQIKITKNTWHTEKIKHELIDCLDLWKSFLGIEELSIENKELTYELVGLTSLLRVENIHLRYMPEEIVPIALLSLYFYMLLFFKLNKTNAYVDTYKLILNDIPLGLVLLTEKDLSLKDESIEKKLHYLRMLKKLPDRLQNSLLRPSK